MLDVILKTFFEDLVKVANDGMPPTHIMPHYAPPPQPVKSRVLPLALGAAALGAGAAGAYGVHKGIKHLTSDKGLKRVGRAYGKAKVKVVSGAVQGAAKEADKAAKRAAKAQEKADRKARAADIAKNVAN